MYKYGTYWNNTPPEDFTKYCVMYNKILYNSPYRDEWNNVIAVPVTSDRELNWKLDWGIKYAVALYLDGQIDESKKIIDECVALVGDKEEFAVYYWSMKDYFYYVYSITDSQDMKNWIVEKENSIDKVCRGMEKYKKFFLKNDCIYHNPPTVEDYMAGAWLEHEYNTDYEATAENIFKQIKVLTISNGDNYEGLKEDIAKITASTLVGDDDSGKNILKYELDERLSFELYDMPFTSCVFYLDGEEYKTMSFDLTAEQE